MERCRLEITTKIGCSCNCYYCPQQKLLKNYYGRYKENDAVSIMSFETFKNCIDKLPTSCRVDFSGMSEPWLNSECTKMLSYAYSKGFELAVYTTLVGMNFDDFETIKEFKFEEFVVHIPDAEKKIHINITRQYRDLLHEILIYRQKDGKRLVTGISCHADIHPDLKDVVPDDIKIINKLHDRAGNVKVGEVTSKSIRGEIICSNCGRNLNYNILLPDGSVVMCCMDYELKHILGNLLTQGWEDIHSGLVANEVKKGFSDDTIDILCRNCVNAKNITELFDEYCLYLDWTRNLCINEEKRLFEISKYKQWIDNLEKSIEQQKENYELWIEDLSTQNEARKKECEEYKSWVANLQKQIMKLQNQKI
jgi:hypothetical protein